MRGCVLWAQGSLVLAACPPPPPAPNLPCDPGTSPLPVSFSSPVDGVGGGGQITSKSLCGSAGPWAPVRQGRAPKAMLAHAGHICQMDGHTKAVWLLRCLLSELQKHHRARSWALHMRDSGICMSRKDPALLCTQEVLCPLLRQLLGPLSACTHSFSAPWPESRVIMGPLRVKSR